MNLNTTILNKINRKLSRQEELEAGSRVNFHRVYKDKTKYIRTQIKRNFKKDLVD